MKHGADEEKLMVDYLLGRLSEEDRAQVEERFLSDNQYLERLQAAEEDLNDSYLRGELSGLEREQFEKRIAASPEWKGRVEFARALGAISAARPGAAVTPAKVRDEPTPWWKSFCTRSFAFNFALATGVMLMFAAGAWLVLETARLRAQLEQVRAERQQVEQELRRQTDDERARADKLAQELERAGEQRDPLQAELEKPPPPERSIVSLILLPGVGRGEEESTKVEVPRDARLVRLDLYVQGPTPYKSYRTELRTADGRMVWSRDNLAARQTRSGKAVALSLPASALTAGKYEMTLKGVISKEQSEDVGYYYFSVMRK